MHKRLQHVADGFLSCAALAAGTDETPPARVSDLIVPTTFPEPAVHEQAMSRDAHELVTFVPGVCRRRFFFVGETRRDRFFGTIATFFVHDRDAKHGDM